MSKGSNWAAAIVFGILATLAAVPLGFALIPPGSRGSFSIVVLALVVLACVMAPDGRRAWGRGSLASGLLYVAFPLVAETLSQDAARGISTQMSATHDASTSIVMGLIGGMMVGFSASVGLALGAVLVILGLVLVLGGRSRP